MTKVALVAPGKNPEFAVQEPLNLGYLASTLEANNIEVVIIDELAGQNVEGELKKFSPDIVGITAVTPLAPDAYRIAAIARQMGALTVMGGAHASVMPEEALNHVDIVVKGEGEQALLDIALGKTKEKILAYPYIKNIDEIPPPSRHLLQMDFYAKAKDRRPKSYLQFIPPGTNVAALLTSRGCPYACAFCHNTWRGTPTRYNSAERVVFEIKLLIEKYGVGGIFFIEDNLFVNRKRLEEICALIKKNNINIVWGGNSRVDNVDREILQIVKDAGCRQVTFGFESGSQKTLDTLNKKTTVEQNQGAIDLCREVGILPQGTVIIGSPGETIEDIKKTQEFVHKNNFEGLIGVSIATPFPGTKLWDWCVEHNRIPKKLSWEEFSYRGTPITMCDAVSTEDLKRLQVETKYSGASITPLSAIKQFLRHPLRLLKEPKRILRAIKRIKF